MNHLRLYFPLFFAIAVAVASVHSASAQFFFFGSETVKLAATVVTPEGAPIPGAKVTLVLPRLGGNRSDKVAEGVTDAKGVVRLIGRAEEMFYVFASRDGYYRDESRRYYTGTDENDAEKKNGVLTLTIKLKPVKNPAPIVQRWFLRSPLPQHGKPFSFDVLIGDWTPPFGKGVVPDITFLASGYTRSLRDSDEQVVLSFHNPEDGIISSTYTLHSGSRLKFPYEAPESGYQNSYRLYRKATPDGPIETNFDNTGTRCYIFRVRSETDSNGKVVRAIYGVINGELSIGGHPAEDRVVTFHSIANPDRTRNLEFDIDRIVDALRDTGGPRIGR